MATIRRGTFILFQINTRLWLLNALLINAGPWHRLATWVRVEIQQELSALSWLFLYGRSPGKSGIHLDRPAAAFGVDAVHVQEQTPFLTEDMGLYRTHRTRRTHGCFYFWLIFSSIFLLLMISFLHFFVFYIKSEWRPRPRVGIALPHPLLWEFTIAITHQKH